MLGDQTAAVTKEDNGLGDGSGGWISRSQLKNYLADVVYCVVGSSS